MARSPGHEYLVIGHEETGVSSLAMEASKLVNRDGIVCLFGVSTRDREEKVKSTGSIQTSSSTTR